MITAKTLTREQAEAMMRRVDPATRYICELYARMNKVGCPGNDSFRLAVERAHDAMRALSAELYYISGKTGGDRGPSSYAQGVSAAGDVPRE